MSGSTEKKFGKWRAFLWPIHAYELKKLIPMLIMAFFISFNYTVVRDTKDGLIMTSAGASAIPFLKTVGTVPAAFLFILIFAKLSNVFDREKLFYVTITPFLLFFGAFALFIYPNRELLHPSVTSVQALQAWLPEGWAGLVGCYQNWTYTLFYILAELWGSAVLSLLFWGFANQITRVSESKRFYTTFGLGFNAALLASGPLIHFLSDKRSELPPGVDPWQWSLNWLMMMFVVGGVIIIATYWWMNRNVLTDARFYDPDERKKEKKKKPKLSIGQSLAFIMRSKYLLCLTVLVAGYGIAINLVEVTWKDRVAALYPNPNDYTKFMGGFSFFTGGVTFLMLLFVGGNMIRGLGWRFAALFTPVVLAITGLGFFGFVMGGDAVMGFVAQVGTSPLVLAVFIGAVQNIMTKSSKYSLFDPTKEMTYIPLDAESKVKGKAAVDVVGARMGKAGGSLIQIVLFTYVGGLAVVTPYIAVILTFVIGAWIAAVCSLSRRFDALTKQREEEAAKAAPAPSKSGELATSS